MQNALQFSTILDETNYCSKIFVFCIVCFRLANVRIRFFSVPILVGGCVGLCMIRFKSQQENNNNALSAYVNVESSSHSHSGHKNHDHFNYLFHLLPIPWTLMNQNIWCLFHAIDKIETKIRVYFPNGFFRQAFFWCSPMVF